MKPLGSLSPRERHLLLGGGAFLLILGVWFYVWQPIFQAKAVQTDRIIRYLALIDLTDQKARARPLVETATTPDLPLAQRLTQSSQEADITLARLDPDGERLRVTVASAPYHSLIVWIASLEAQSSVRAVSVEMSRLTAPGMVSLRMTVEDAG